MPDTTTRTTTVTIVWRDDADADQITETEGAVLAQLEDDEAGAVASWSIGTDQDD